MGLYILIAAAFVLVCLYVIIHVIERNSKKKDILIATDTPKPINSSLKEQAATTMELSNKMKKKAHKASGIPPSRFASDPYVSVHGIIWNTSDDPVNQGFMETETNFEGFGNGGSFGGGGASGSWDSDDSSSSSSSSSYDSNDSDSNSYDSESYDSDFDSSSSDD